MKSENDIISVPGLDGDKEYLECEKNWVYDLLIATAGWFGAYTFIQRGGVFCNAQTANVVLFAMAIGQGNIRKALYLLLPIGAYFFGAFLSEYLGKSIKRFHFLRWDTVLIGIEILTVVVLGFIPAKAPDQICQVVLNFICSMQFNTFRQMEGIPAATTFVTNHIRQVGHFLAKYVRHHEKTYSSRVKAHGRLILFFLCGAIVSTVTCRFFEYRSIWGSALILLIVFGRLFHADISYEKDLLTRVPHGH